MKPNKISAILLFAGEESIKQAIESVDFCNEIMVIHDCSSGEKNISMLPKNNPNIKISHKSLTSFAGQRNFGLERAKSEWVLFLDSDEFISEKLSKRIKLEINSNKKDGYLIRRIDNFVGKPISKGELLNISLLRLAKRNAGKWRGVVHETWRINGRVGKISEPILHNPHPTIYNFISEIDKYTTLRSEELGKTRTSSNSFTIFIYTFGKFIWNYFFKLGFMEGNRGFVLSMIMSFHSFLVRSKLYQSAQLSYSKRAK